MVKTGTCSCWAHNSGHRESQQGQQRVMESTHDHTVLAGRSNKAHVEMAVPSPMGAQGGCEVLTEGRTRKHLSLPLVCWKRGGWPVQESAGSGWPGRLCGASQKPPEGLPEMSKGGGLYPLAPVTLLDGPWGTGHHQSKQTTAHSPAGSERTFLSIQVAREPTRAAGLSTALFPRHSPLHAISSCSGGLPSRVEAPGGQGSCLLDFLVLPRTHVVPLPPAPRC